MPPDPARWWSRFAPWMSPAFPATGAVVVTLYTRAGCCLCDEVKSLLLNTRRDLHVSVSIVDVDSDPVLQREFGDHVPVVTINGQPRFRGRFPVLLLERALTAAARGADGQTVSEPDNVRS